MASAADMMMARDAVARAFFAMRAAEAAANTDVTEANCAAVSVTRKAWVRAVKAREAVERRMWREQDARAASSVAA